MYNCSGISEKLNSHLLLFFDNMCIPTCSWRILFGDSVFTIFIYYYTPIEIDA